MLQKPTLNLHHVGNRNRGKITAVNFTGLGIDTAWTGRSAASAQQVGANHKKTVRVNRFAGSDYDIPPTRVILFVVFRHVGVPTNRMTHQDCVIAVGVKLTVDFVSNGDTRKAAAFFQLERLVKGDRFDIAQWPGMSNTVTALKGRRLHNKPVLVRG